MHPKLPSYPVPPERARSARAWPALRPHGPARARTPFPRAAAACALLGGLLLLAAGAAAAQQPVAGRVVDGSTLRPIIGAQVLIDGTQLGTTTDGRGEFRFASAAGTEVTLRVVMLGYREYTRTVPVGRTDLVLTLSEMAIALDAVVVTGTVGERQRRAIGNVVGRIDVAELQEIAPARQVQDMLSAQVAGVRIMRSGGEIGTGGITRIRGASSLTLSANPLLYIDGVRADGADFTGGVGTFAFAAGQLPSRINDINPEDIESIEVIKGPAAATLYGTEASNGVIHIITKKGTRGAPQINLRMREGAYWLPDAINHFAPTHFRCTGVSQQANVHPLLRCNAGEIVEVNVLRLDKEILGRDWFRTGRQPAIGADVTGGSETVRYFFSGDYSREEGYLPYNWQNRLWGRANLGYTPSERYNIDFGMGASRGRSRSASTQQPLSTHIIWSCPSPGCEAGSGAPNALDGPLRGYIGAVPEVFENDVHGHQNVDRVTASITFSHRPFDWLSHRLAAGGEFTNIQDTDLRRATRNQEYPGNTFSEGMKRVGHTRGLLATIDYGGSASLAATSDITLTTSFGAQYTERRQESSQARGDVFPLAALETVSAGANRFAFEEFFENKTFGLYIQEEVAWRNRLFLTGAVRGDDNSAFGENYTFVTYPKVSASWVLGEEPFLADVEWLTSLRLRSAWGRSGMQPNFFDALRTYQPVIGAGGASAVTPQNIGNPDLKPEVSTELEFGFDAALLDQRVSLEFTRYVQRTRDGLVRVPALPSLGFPGVQLQNLGEIRNQGIELSANAEVYRSRAATLSLGLTLSSSKSEVVDLGGQPPVVESAGFGQYHVEGFPLASIFFRRVVSADLVPGATPALNSATNILCEGGERVPGTNFSRGGGPPVPCANAPGVYWGQPLPEWEGGINATLTLFENLRLYGLVDFIKGRTWIDNDVIAVHNFFLNSRQALERTDPILLAYRQIGQDRQPGILSGDFAKLRTISAQYRVPDRLARSINASRLFVTVTGENFGTLWRPDEFSFGHRSLDPERTRQTGSATPGFLAFNQERWPTGRRVTVTTRVTF
jgi:TonB-linked SusC/RagA family outer membrane protein